MRNLYLLGATLLCSACVSSGASDATGNNAANTNAATSIPVSPAPQPASMQGMLEAHNQTRAVVAVAPLIWSSQMSQYAQQWAEHLATKNNCQMQHRSAAGANTLAVGENIYWASPLRWSDGRTEIQSITPSQVALDWASEKADYNYASNTCRTGAKCGHYTQMVWHTTAEVGCGMSICPDKGQIWVCNYNPPGNWVGEKPY